MRCLQSTRRHSTTAFDLYSANDCVTFRIITVGRRPYERYLNLNEAILWPRLGRGCSLFRVYHALDHCERMHCERNNNGGRRNASRRSTWFERGHISALRKPRCCDPGAFPGSRNKLSDRAGRRRPTQGGCKRPPRRLSRVCIHARRELGHVFDENTERRGMHADELTPVAREHATTAVSSIPGRSLPLV